MTEADERDRPGSDISDEDVREAMQEIPGYLDITYGDFRELYHVASRHARRRVRRSLRAKALMTSPAVAVRPDTPLAEAAELMAREGVSGLPVTDARGRAVGVLSATDFLARMGGGVGTNFMGVVARCLRGEGCLAVPIRGATAGDMMTAPPITVAEEATVFEAAEQMARAGISRVPVITEHGEVVGVLSRTDLVRAHLE